jgi:hypothetical protein
VLNLHIIGSDLRKISRFPTTHALPIVTGGSRIKSHSFGGSAEIIQGKVVLVPGTHHKNSEIAPLTAGVQLGCMRLRITPPWETGFSAAENAAAELKLR